MFVDKSTSAAQGGRKAWWKRGVSHFPQQQCYLWGGKTIGKHFLKGLSSWEAIKQPPQTQFSIKNWFSSKWFPSFQSFKACLCTCGRDKNHSQERLSQTCKALAPTFVCFSQTWLGVSVSVVPLISALIEDFSSAGLDLCLLPSPCKHKDKVNLERRFPSFYVPGSLQASFSCFHPPKECRHLATRQQLYFLFRA